MIQKEEFDIVQEIGRLEMSVTAIMKDIKTVKININNQINTSQCQMKKEQQQQQQQDNDQSTTTKQKQEQQTTMVSSSAPAPTTKLSQALDLDILTLTTMGAAESPSLTPLNSARSSTSISRVPRLSIVKMRNSGEIANPSLVKKWIDDTIKTPTSTKHLQDSSKIKLDVGGRHFATTLATLTKYPDSMLAAMFSSRFELPRDEDGRIFIDRDGKLFAHILAYLRDGPLWTPPVAIDMKKRLEIEFAYYGLEPVRTPTTISPTTTPRCVCVAHAGEAPQPHHQGSWSPVPNFSSNIRSYRMLVSHNNAIYAITERSSQSNGAASTFQCEAYTVEAGWTFKCAILETMAEYYMVAAVVGDQIYAIPDAGLHQPIFRFDTVESRWRTTNDYLPTGRTSFALAVLDEYLYVIGGYKGSTPCADVDRYHPRTGSWCTVSSMGAKRAECSAVVLDDAIYVIGGSQPTSTVERYNPHTNAWTLVCNLSNSRFTISTSAMLEGKIYAIGSENECEGLNIVLQFSPATNTWRRVAPIAYNCYYTNSALAIDNYIYFVPWSPSVIFIDKSNFSFAFPLDVPFHFDHSVFF
eukprot:gene4017-4652_t